jgi:hypothetical protein
VDRGHVNLNLCRQIVKPKRQRPLVSIIAGKVHRIFPIFPNLLVRALVPIGHGFALLMPRNLSVADYCPGGECLRISRGGFDDNNELARAIAACTAPHEDQLMPEFNARTVFRAQMETLVQGLDDAYGFAQIINRVE